MMAPRSLYRIVVLEGAAKDRRYYLREAGAEVGRDAACGIVIDDDAVAARHLRLRVDGEAVRAEPHDGVPEVYRLGKPLRTGTALRDGDVLEIGAVKLQFQRVEPLPQYDGRKKPVMERAATLGVCLVLAVQAVGLLVLWLTPPSRVPGTAGEAEAAADAADDLAAAPASNVVETAGAAAVEPPVDRPPAAEPAGADPDAEAMAMAAEMADEPAASEPAEEGAEGEWTTILFEARRAIADGRLDEADALLAEAEAMSPEMTAPLVTRARLFERRGRIEEAIAQWDAVLERVEGTAYAQEATAERMRLARMKEREAPEVEAADAEPDSAAGDADAAAVAAATEQSASRPPRPEPVVSAGAASEPPAAEIVTARPSPRLRILDTRREKFQDRENYEEIRMVRVVLAPREGMGDLDLDPDAVEVQVRFFDRVPDTGQVLMSGVPTPTRGLRVEGAWPGREQKTLSALYMVPSGFRENERRQTGHRRQFYGYVVQVLYDGVMQDEAAFPASLLARSRRLL